MVRKEIKNLAVMTLITVLVWTLYEALSIRQSTQIPEEYYTSAAEFSSELDTELIISLGSKLNFSGF
jgi:hypothetical protein